MSSLSHTHFSFSLNGIPSCFWALSEFVRHPSASIGFLWFPVLARQVACKRNQGRNACFEWYPYNYIFIEERQFACRCFSVYSGTKLCCFLLRDETGENSPKKGRPSGRRYQIDGRQSAISWILTLQLSQNSFMSVFSFDSYVPVDERPQRAFDYLILDLKYADWTLETPQLINKRVCSSPKCE